MGYYYEFHIKVKLVKTLPDEVVNFLQSWIINETYESFTGNMDHAFFTGERWENCFYQSAFHDEKPFFCKYPSGYYGLELHGEIKQGYREIEDCANWLSQWVVGRKKKQYIGWYKGESWEIPRINLYVEK